MAWTNPEETRIETIEKLLNQMQTAINNLASQQQLRSLVALKQKEIADLTTRVSSLESQVTLLQKGS